MLINEIPDDCLLAIFDYLNNLDDLINCYKVCVKWSYLIAKRTKKVKHLIEIPSDYYRRGYSSDVVYYQEPWSIDSRCLPKLFTNLILIQNGFICFDPEPWPHPLEKYCDQLEMLSVINFNPNNVRNGSSLKQLDVRQYSLEAFKRDAHYLPNLERLKMCTQVPDKHYDGPVLEKLKILELSHECWSPKIFYGFQLMDSCPNLQSAHVTIYTNSWFFDETLKNKCLQDLFIHFAAAEYGFGNAHWNNLKRLLPKYPNLKHLALRYYSNIKDEHIEELVHILPNLVLLDVIECKGVTQRAADYIKDYCKRCGRSIKFYFKGNQHEIKPYRFGLSKKRENISRGFDFMKHCFRKDYGYLPHFLIPIDY
uniref:F-box domain-containing protein n=1 Tax=Tetranychus urticae TaxID=32264 RepID=T1KYA7_TETUR